MDIHLIFAVLSSLIGLSCIIPYVRDIFRRTTQPHIVSWLIWAILQITTVFAIFSAGAGIGVIPAAISVLLYSFICVLALKFGTKNITRFDLICFLAALCALGIYVLTKDALLSVVLVAVIDVIAYMPTLRKAYTEPYTETVMMFVLSALANLFALGSLELFTLTTSLCFISFGVANLVCVFTILLRRNFVEAVQPALS